MQVLETLEWAGSLVIPLQCALKWNIFAWNWFLNNTHTHWTLREETQLISSILCSVLSNMFCFFWIFPFVRLTLWKCWCHCFGMAAQSHFFKSRKYVWEIAKKPNASDVAHWVCKILHAYGKESGTNSVVTGTSILIPRETKCKELSDLFTDPLYSQSYEKCFNNGEIMYVPQQWNHLFLL